MLGLNGLNCAEYVQLCVGSVAMEVPEFWFQILMHPSHEEDRNVSLEMRFQWTEKTSRACSDHDAMGNRCSEISKSLMLPSPLAVRIWSSCASDHVRSKRPS